MADKQLPHRCPKCNALVVDRRSPTCTTCHAELPAEWVMTPEQVTKLGQIDSDARSEHAEEMKKIDPLSDPNLPAWLKILESDPSRSGWGSRL